MTRSRWAVVELAHVVAGHFERGWHALPRRNQEAWARALIIGTAITFLTLFALVAYGKYTIGHGEFNWEIELLRAIELYSPVNFSGAVWFQTFGTDIVLVIVVLTAASIAMWREKPLLGLTILLSMVMMDAAVRIGWLSWARIRPEIIAEGIARPSFHSFPSGHTAKTVAVYGLLIAHWFRASNHFLEKSLAVSLAAFIFIGVPFGRVRMGAHWPTDVMGGWLIGGVWLAAMLFALKQGEKQG